MLTVTTGADGRATAVVQQPNGVEGEYAVRVDASYQGLMSTVNIPLSNVTVIPAASARFPMKWLIIGAVAAGAASVAAVSCCKSEPPVITTMPTVPNIPIVPPTPANTTISVGGAVIR